MMPSISTTAIRAPPGSDPSSSTAMSTQTVTRKARSSPTARPVPSSRLRARDATRYLLLLLVLEIVVLTPLPSLGTPAAPAIRLRGLVQHHRRRELLERESDPPLVGVHPDHQQGELVAHVDQVGRRGDGPVGHLRDVQQAVHAR